MTAGDDRRDPRIAVVIITRNRSEELLHTLARMASLPENPRIVVVDNGSSDGTPARVGDRFPAIDVIPLGANLGAAGRTVGVELVKEPYVAFCDDDCWWEPGSLARAADLLDNHPRLALISGRVLIGTEEREDPTCRVMEKSPLRAVDGLPGTPILGFLAGASMVRRSAFLDAGGFERRLFLGCEEILLALDLAVMDWQLAYVKDVVVHHHPSARRESSGRRLIHSRNSLWVDWLRRPATHAIGRTLAALLANFPDPLVFRAFMEAARGLPWVLRHRRVIPPHLHGALRQIEKGL